MGKSISIDYVQFSYDHDVCKVEKQEVFRDGKIVDLYIYSFDGIRRFAKRRKLRRTELREEITKRIRNEQHPH
jgi:hypothetical protein